MNEFVGKINCNVGIQSCEGFGFQWGRMNNIYCYDVDWILIFCWLVVVYVYVIQTSFDYVPKCT